MKVFSDIRTDLIDEDLTKPEKPVIVEDLFLMEINKYEKSVRNDRLKTPYPAKNYKETIALIKESIDSYEEKEHLNTDTRITFTYSDIERDIAIPAVVVLPDMKLPGQWEKGPPTRSLGIHREVKKHLREVIEDPDYPGYSLGIFGQWFDNWTELQCWAYTEKEAFDLVEKVEHIIDEYKWFYQMSGVKDILFQERRQRVTYKRGDNIFFGYTLIYLIRTEEITLISEKNMERLVIKLGISST